MSASDLSSLNTMRTEGFAELVYPEHLDKVIGISAAAWKAFLALPDDAKKRFGYLKDTGNSGAGYEFPDLTKPDVKHVFHAKLKDRAWLYEQAALVGYDEARVLVETSLAAIEELIPFVAEFCERMEREFDLGDFRKDFLADTDECILRHLHYPPGFRAAGELIAARHVDKGCFTLHNRESHPGVERLTLDTKQWVPFPTRKGRAVMFGSFRLQQRSRNQLKGLEHRVVLVPEAVDTGRNSTVFFSNVENTPYYDKETWGPMQNFPEGFTYDLTLEELDRYFMPYQK